MTLPDGWTTRRPTLDDIAAILAVVHASDIASVGYPDFGADEVEEVLRAPNFDPAADSWLAVDPAGEVVAWAYLENPHGADRENVEVYVHPEHGVPAQPPLLDLLLGRVVERAAAAGREQVRVRAGAIPTELRYIALLRSAGFAFVKRYARMARPLTAADARLPDPPPGVLIRPLRSVDDADLRTFFTILDAAFQDTPDYLPQTYQRWRERLAVIAAPEWDEWLVAEVDGVAVGIVQSASDKTTNAGPGPSDGDARSEGWVRNLAVLREHRGRGVGRALLRHAFAIYAAKGRAWAGLGVDLTNPTRAYDLYTSVGMSASYEADIYERTVSAAG
ncbi:GNAT family N-acetyltransferase [Pilimelia columellifera]|uniref:N-acetyltransferase domain-containing protein n=1 Tax=Pilimelia columellifera subsp. columellifera TaxID=706583 RepID=A0ABN3NJD1_9ACTN